MSANSWHGASFAQWIDLWDAASWRAHIRATLIEVARSRAARPKDRVMALQTLNEAIARGILPADPGYPSFTRDVLLDVVVGARPTLLDRLRSRRIRRECSTRLLGTRWMLQTAYQFLPPGEADLDDLPQSRVALLS